MATRFYLPSSGAPSISPSVKFLWNHVPASVPRREMSPIKRNTAFANIAYAPDAADHLVVNRSLIAQFLSPPLKGDQNISAQNITLVVSGAEDHAGNTLGISYAVAVLSNDGVTTRGVLLSFQNDNVEVPVTTPASRTHTAVCNAVSALDGDRLVFEVGLIGTPINSGGVQGHNGLIRFGDSSATDLAATDGVTTDNNPWIELETDTLVFQDITSESAQIRASSHASVVAAKGASSTTNVRSLHRATNSATKGSIATASIRSSGWLSSVHALVTTYTANIFGRAYLSCTSIKSISATTAIRSNSRTQVSSTKAVTSTASIRSQSRLINSVAKAVSSTVSIRGLARSLTTSTKAVSSTTSVRTRTRALTIAAKAISNTAAIRSQSRVLIASTKATAYSASIRSTSRLLSVAAKTMNYTTSIHSVGRLAVLYTKNGIVTASIRAIGHLANTQVHGGLATTIIRTMGRGSSQWSKQAFSAASIRATSRASTEWSKAVSSESIIRSLTRASSVATKATSHAAGIRERGQLYVSATTNRISSVVFRGIAHLQSTTAPVGPSTVGSAIIRSFGYLTSAYARNSLSTSRFSALSRLLSAGQKAATTPSTVITARGYMAIVPIANKIAETAIRGQTHGRTQHTTGRRTTTQINSVGRLDSTYQTQRFGSSNIYALLIGYSSQQEEVIIVATATATITLINRATATIAVEQPTTTIERHNETTASIERV